MSVVRGLAPYALTVHLKDQVATPYEQGYLLWDAPLGQGFLDLEEILRIVRSARLEAKLNLEVITRDPLKVPVYTDAYWATLPGQREAALKWIEPMVKNSPQPRQNMSLASLSADKQMTLEQRNCEQSLRYAREHLKI